MEHDISSRLDTMLRCSFSRLALPESQKEAINSEFEN